MDSIKSRVKSTNGLWTLSNKQKTLMFQSAKTAIESKILVDFTKIDDEYYIISLFDRNDGRRYYYKCDQLDGLERCIEEKINCRLNLLKENQSWSVVIGGFDINKIEKFTKTEWNKINDMFSSTSTSSHLSSQKVFSVEINNNWDQIKLCYYSQSRYGLGKDRFVIYKLQDEWFFVVDPNKRKFYKCDQIDGLIECLKNNFYL